MNAAASRKLIWWSLTGTKCVFAVWLVGYSPMSQLGPRRYQAQADIRQLINTIRAYFTEFSSSPGSTHVSIIASLGGQNPRRILFYEFPPNRMSASREFVDPWGSPYYLEAIDATRPIVRSFGPNRKDDGGRVGSDDILDAK